MTLMNSLVVVLKGEDPYRTTQQALQQIPLTGLEGKKGLDKTECRACWHYRVKA